MSRIWHTTPMLTRMMWPGTEAVLPRKAAGCNHPHVVREIHSRFAAKVLWLVKTFVSLAICDENCDRLIAVGWVWRQSTEWFAVSQSKIGVDWMICLNGIGIQNAWSQIGSEWVISTLQCFDPPVLSLSQTDTIQLSPRCYAPSRDGSFRREATGSNGCFLWV